MTSKLDRIVDGVVSLSERFDSFITRRSDTANVGICHWGKGGAGGDPRCGNRRGHMSFSQEKFAQIEEVSRCKGCNAIYKKFEERAAEKASRGDADAESYVGKLIKFKEPSLSGPVTRAGMVKRVLPNGKLEVKRQLGGYMEVSVEEIIS